MEEERVIIEIENMYKDITLLEFNRKEEFFKNKYKQANNHNTRRQWKRFIFSLNMADYKKERIWEYLNNDISKSKFDYFVDAIHKGWFK